MGTAVAAKRPLLSSPGLGQWEGVARIIQDDRARDSGPLRASEGGEAKLGSDLTDHRASKALPEQADSFRLGWLNDGVFGI